MSNLYSPTIEQGLIQTWEQNFITLAQQRDSMLSMLPAVKYSAFTGTKHNVPRTGKTEMNKVAGRNPDKQYDEFLVDNRQIVRNTFAKTFIFDEKDIREMMADPTSEAYKSIMAAINREKDRVIARACLASVLVGDPNNNSALTSLSAANDGVKTIDATAGLTYALLKKGMTNFINNDIVSGELRNANLSFICGGTDLSDLLDEDKFINNEYTASRPVDDGYISKVFGMNVVALAGSETSNITVANPILTESGTTRSCLLLAPQSVLFSMENMKVDYEDKVPGKIRSKSLTVSVDMGAMRIEGARVQAVSTTF